MAKKAKYKTLAESIKPWRDELRELVEQPIDYYQAIRLLILAHVALAPTLAAVRRLREHLYELLNGSSEIRRLRKRVMRTFDDAQDGKFKPEFTRVYFDRNNWQTPCVFEEIYAQLRELATCVVPTIPAGEPVTQPTSALPTDLTSLRKFCTGRFEYALKPFKGRLVDSQLLDELRVAVVEVLKGLTAATEVKLNEVTVTNNASLVATFVPTGCVEFRLNDKALLVIPAALADVLSYRESPLKKCVFTLEVEYDPKRTEPESLSCALDRLLDTAMSTPYILDDYGEVRPASFMVPPLVQPPFDLWQDPASLGGAIGNINGLAGVKFPE